MAFEKEAISQLERDDSPLLRSIRTLNGDPLSAIRPTWCWIDRERNARFIPLGGGGGPFPWFCALVWNNSVFDLEMKHWSRLRIEEGEKLIDEYFLIEPGFIKAEFTSQKNAIEELIREALISYANNKTGATLVRFSEKYFDVEDRLELLWQSAKC